MAPLAASHIWAVLSLEAVTTCPPSGLNIALLIRPRCRSGFPISTPLAASQTRAASSPDTVTTHLPSGLNAARDTTSSCLKGSPSRVAVATSHTLATFVAAQRMSSAALPDAVITRAPSGLNPALFTGASCFMGFPTIFASFAFHSCGIGIPVSASHSCAVESVEAVTTRTPSGLNTALLIEPSCTNGLPISAPLAVSQFERYCRWILSLHAGHRD